MALVALQDVDRPHPSCCGHLDGLERDVHGRLLAAQPEPGQHALRRVGRQVAARARGARRRRVGALRWLPSDSAAAGRHCTPEQLVCVAGCRHLARRALLGLGGDAAAGRPAVRGGSACPPPAPGGVRVANAPLIRAQGAAPGCCSAARHAGLARVASCKLGGAAGGHGGECAA